MPLVFALAIALAGWAWWSGRLGSDPGRKLAIIGSALLSAWLLLRGQTIPGGALGAAATGMALAGMLRRKVGAIPMDEAEARQLLGLPLDADEAAIRAAHRRLIAQVHPDHGGTAELARRVNAARDVLLAAVRPPR